MEDGCDIKWEDTIEFTFPIKGGRVIKVYDADTITIASKLPYDKSPLYRLSVRLNGIDTPENYYSWTWGDALFVVLDVYRTEIAPGSTPADPGKPNNWDWTLGQSQYLWKLEQPAHAVANGYFMGCINRVGTEMPWNLGQFYGTSYFVNPLGEIIACASEDKDELLVAAFDLDLIETIRSKWQFFRDRRPETYNEITQL